MRTEVEGSTFHPITNVNVF